MAALSPIVVASSNPHKVAEIRAVLAPAGVGVIGLADLEPEGAGAFEPPSETGETFEANAAIKALAYAAQTGLACLADDSGLEVDALDGAPGVRSSRYSLDAATDERDDPLPRAERDRENNGKLLRALAGVPPAERTARFVCTMALAEPGPIGGAGFQPAPGASREPCDGSFRAHHRRLPHWQQGGATYFVTWRLRSGELSPEERQIVADACAHWNGSRITLYAATVMPNHVHMLFRMIQQADGSWPELPELVRSIKRHSAHEIQRRRGHSGPLWQREYFDRIVRSGHEAAEKLAYIEANPVKWGLCEKPGDYPFLVRRSGRLETGPTTASPTTASPTAGTSEIAEAHPASEASHSPRESRPGPGIIATTRGTFAGRIGLPDGREAERVPRGDNGFGYDPLLVLDDGRTAAQLSSEEKNARSHRGEATRLMGERLAALRAGG